MGNNYVVKNENIVITCSNITEPFTINVNGTGIFSLETYCQANTADDYTELIPERKVTSKVFQNYVPQFHVTILILK